MELLERFLKYTKISTPSSSTSTTFPSTDCQKNLAEVLIKELQELGVEVYYDSEHCYVYGVLKGNIDAPSLGFISHLDTSEDANGVNVNPQIIENYNGEPIKLQNNITIDSTTYPDLKKHLNKTVITSDGTTLLGADDKAGIAEIMTMLEYFSNNNASHGDIWICFTPDEEIGKDIKYFDLNRFPTRYAYTVDGKDLGEIAYENFNAASINIKIKGTISHLGYAKGILVNSLTIANRLYSLLPDETPSNTEGREGYYHLLSMEGDESLTTMNFIIRDFDKGNFNVRKEFFKMVVKKLNEEYGDRIEMVITDTYYNMKEIIDDSWHLVEKARSVMKALNVTPISEPIRGGTSGARLSYMGLPCPNIGTGGHNFHSYTEYITLEDMLKTSEILIEIVKEYARDKDVLKLEKKQ